jgi:hypothetical protein
LIGLTLANVTTGGIKVSVYHQNGATNTYIVKDALIYPGTTFVAIGGSHKIVLTESDKVYAVSDTASSVDAIMSLVEI